MVLIKPAKGFKAWWFVYDSRFLLEASWKNESSFERQGLEEERLVQYQERRQRGEREGGREAGKEGFREEKKLSIVANNMPIL